jgi:cytochrome c peroxidase
MARIWTLSTVAICAGLAAAVGVSAASGGYTTREALGAALFFDVNLSKNRTQACATCHDPETGFADPRGVRLGMATSLGDDGEALGDRNAPTASYAAFSPRFHKREDGKWIGGQFLDGREDGLEGQAGGPPLNPLEMGMTDKAEVIARLQENSDYISAFSNLYGENIMQDPDAAYGAMTDAIATFERSSTFAPFDSKYDRFLRGEVELTKEEDLGRLLFFSQQFTNCNICHQLRTSAVDPRETFSNYEFHNIGVPANPELERQLGHPVQDMGLAAHINDPAQRGKFKVPTLRNVAVTGPYMHNGVFKDLRTVILFYNKYNSRAAKRQINPETGTEWATPEVSENISLEELKTGPALKDDRIDALVAFLKTLTDARYEPFLAELVSEAEKEEE